MIRLNVIAEGQTEEKFLRDVLAPHLADRGVHEFETLLLVEPRSLGKFFLKESDAIDELSRIVAEYDSPEFINDGETTAPSKRIIRLIPDYEHQKVSAGPGTAQAIGLPKLREGCPHFGAWITKLEALGSP